MNLVKRRLRVDSACPLCKAEPEDSHHILWYCSILQQLWFQLKLVEDFGAFTSDRITNFVNAFLAMDINSKKFSAISLWALCYGQDLSFVKAKDLTSGMQRTGLWRPPEPGIIKLNFDASFKSKSNRSISAVLARDFEGLIMGACTYPIVDVADAFVAEVRAYRSVLSPISQHIRVLAEAFEEVTYNFVPREANRAAHELVMRSWIAKRGLAGTELGVGFVFWRRFSESPGMSSKFSLPVVGILLLICSEVCWYSLAPCFGFGFAFCFCFVGMYSAFDLLAVSLSL
ncbi:hypothetical protein Gotur_024472 [Gossypium turneri]